MTDIVHRLSSLPCNDGNFISALSRATDAEITTALDIMGTIGCKNKGRILACQRELRKRVNKRHEEKRGNDLSIK